MLPPDACQIGLSAGIVSYTAMMSACTHGGMWQNTLRTRSQHRVVAAVVNVLPTLLVRLT